MCVVSEWPTARINYSSIYSHCIHDFVDFTSIFTKNRLISLPTTLEFEQGKSNTFYFTGSFRCFRLNKSVLETTETKQASSQLYFAPRIIKIHLLVFENELIEDAVLVLKKFQNWKLPCMNVPCMLGELITVTIIVETNWWIINALIFCTD